jgi:hypothetical protein
MRPGQRACEECGEQILRLFTISGQLVDLDPNPHDDGTRIVVTVAGDIRARTLTGHDLPAPAGTGHRQHWCPAKGDVGPSCANPRCSLPMARTMDGKPNRDSYHPSCEPWFQDLLLAEKRARINAQFKRPRKRK